MNQDYVSQSFSLALARTSDILLHPFSLKNWIKLIIIAVMAGAVGGSQINLPTGNFGDFQGITDEPEACQASPDPSAEETPGRATPCPSMTTGLPNTVLPSHFSIMAGILIFMLLVGMAVSVFFTWVSARFKFIFYDAIVTKTPSIRSSWRKHREAGNSYFWLCLVVFLYFLAVLLIGVGLAAGILYLSGSFSNGFDGVALVVVLSCLLVLTLAAVPGWIFLHYADQFVVPIMAQSGVGWKEGVVILWKTVRANKLPFLIYLPLAMAIGIGGAVATSLLMIAAGVVVMILAALVLGAPYFALGWSTSYAVYLVAAGTLLALFLIALMSGCSLPVPVFFRSFSLCYLGVIAPEFSIALVEDRENAIDKPSSGELSS